MISFTGNDSRTICNGHAFRTPKKPENAAKIKHFINNIRANDHEYKVYIHYILKKNCALSLTLYQNELTTDKKPTGGYSIRDEISTTCFQLCELV